MNIANQKFNERNVESSKNFSCYSDFFEISEKAIINFINNCKNQRNFNDDFNNLLLKFNISKDTTRKIIEVLRDNNREDILISNNFLLENNKEKAMILENYLLKNEKSFDRIIEVINNSDRNPFKEGFFKIINELYEDNNFQINNYNFIKKFCEKISNK
jgi:hypothetical protein